MVIYQTPYVLLEKIWFFMNDVFSNKKILELGVYSYGPLAEKSQWFITPL